MRENHIGMGRSFFHLHLVSDSTGETLLAVSRAASAQYQGISAIEHIYPLVRNSAQLDRVLQEIDQTPGIVLYTLVDRSIADRLEASCREAGCPCLSVLEPVHTLFQSYLGIATTPRPGAQHMLNAEYFRRIDALNFTMMHDDGQLTDGVEQADVILVGVSRTSKTPTCVYLAHRGVKAANVPLVPNVPLPPELFERQRPLVVGLTISADRLVHIRRNRLVAMKETRAGDYTEEDAVRTEIMKAQKLFEREGWPTIDVSRRSIEETAAAVLNLLAEQREP